LATLSCTTRFCAHFSAVFVSSLLLQLMERALGKRPKRVRKRKFAARRHPYQAYDSAPFKRSELAKEVASRAGERGALSSVARAHNVPKQTLLEWVKTYTAAADQVRATGCLCAAWEARL
jgi:hypothetical protein